MNQRLLNVSPVLARLVALFVTDNHQTNCRRVMLRAQAKSTAVKGPTRSCQAACRSLPRGSRALRTRKGPPRWTALVLVFALGQLPLALAEDQYTLTDLGKLWAYESRATSINSAGQVVGTLTGGFLPAKDHVFLYSEGELHDLHDAVAKTKKCMWNMRTTGLFITDMGDVVGWVFCSGSEIRHGVAETWFVYRNGAAVVAAGTIGGSSKAREFPVSVGGKIHIFRVDEDGTTHDSGALAGAAGFPTGMNSAGQVVGWSVGSGQTRAWTWSDRTLRELGPFGDLSSKAFAINAAGDIVGAADRSKDERHAFLYRGSSIRDLGTLGGQTSVAYGINTKGQIVGWSAAEPATAGGQSSPARAFLYEDGQMKDLSRHLAGPAAQFVILHEATAINDSGMVAANGTDSRSSGMHAYLLKPVSKNP
jgi:probable HAF family extracellular repeat protein